jgi:hypothetical protein
MYYVHPVFAQWLLVWALCFSLISIFFSNRTVLLADDRTLKALNTLPSGKEKPTHVLSFPGHVAGSGDIAISLQTVRREARAEGRRPNRRSKAWSSPSSPRGLRWVSTSRAAL